MSIFKNRLETPWAWLILFCLIAATCALAFSYTQQSQHMAKKQFEYNQKQVIDEVRFSISAHEKVFRGGLGLFLASNFVDRTEWKSYVDALDLDSLFPSVKSLSYIRLVSNTNEQTYIEDKKKEGFKDFKIFPEKSSKILAPATYIEPFNMQGKSLHGFDFYSIEPFRKAMEFSRDSGKTTIAHPLDPEVLPWSQQHQSHYVMFIPHYSENQRLFRSVVERRKAFKDLSLVYLILIRS